MTKGSNGAAFRNRIVGEGDEAPDQLLANPLNWRVHPKEQVDALEGLLKQVGWVQRVIVNKRTGHVVDGHARVALALRRSEATLPVLYVDLSEDEERLVLAAIDPIGGMAGTDQALLDSVLEGLVADDAGLQALLESLASAAENAAGETGDQAATATLADRFMLPPFSVFSARDGWWQARKRAWLALGIKSELGRGGGAGTPPHPPTVTRNADGTLNYSGTAGQSERFDRQRQPAGGEGVSRRERQARCGLQQAPARRG